MDHPFIEECSKGTVTDVIELMKTAKQSQVHVTNKRGMSALHVASAKGREEIVSLLLENGAHVSATDVLGNTPLHYCGHKEAAAILVDWGADPLARNKRGDIPLDLMKRRGVEVQLLNFMNGLLQEGMQYSTATDELSEPLLPQVQKVRKKRYNIQHVKSVCAEFCVALGLKRLFLVLFILSLISLYFALMITGYNKQQDLLIPVDDQNNKLEL